MRAVAIEHTTKKHDITGRQVQDEVSQVSGLTEPTQLCVGQVTKVPVTSSTDHGAGDST